MDRMKTQIAVFGSNGMLGHTIASFFEKTSNYDVKRITREDFDAEKDGVGKIRNLAKFWDEHTVVINAIGMIPQKYSLQDNANLSSYIRVNSLFPHLLSLISNKKGATMIHITTDCVYNGKQGPYTEGQIATETNFYGVSKACGEPEDAMIIRTSIVGEEQTGKKSLLEWVRSQEGQTINGFTHHFWNGLTCLEVARMIQYCLQHHIRWSGVRHIVSPETVSKYELVSMINEIYDLKITVIPKETETIHKGLVSSPYLTLPVAPLRKQIQEQREFFLSHQ
jgi:dTDP-4-dehydrorhamnose reductase